MKGLLSVENPPERPTFQAVLPVRSSTLLVPGASDSPVGGHPPRAVRPRFGNLRRREFHAPLARVGPRVETPLKAHKPVTLHADRVEGVN